jgi:NADH-quinone oxidoreductase subunit H
MGHVLYGRIRLHVFGVRFGRGPFSGGGGAIHPKLSFIPSYVWFFGKTFFLAFLFILFRWTYPRLRVDRLMEFCWKFLLPWALANVVLAGFFFLMGSR